MYRKIFSLMLIFGLFSFEIKSDLDLLKAKKEKAVAVNKIYSPRKNVPNIYENSVVFKKAPQQVINENQFNSRGDYAYSLKPIKLDNKSSSIPNDLLKSNQANSIDRLNSFIEDDLRVVIMGPGQKVMMSNGSFIVRFNDKKDKNIFRNDYNLILTQEFPDFVIFKANSFLGINNLLDQINNDLRINYLELNLLDPNIQKH